MDPKLWTPQDLADFLQMDVETVMRFVVQQKGFPKGFRPTGKARGEIRWFADEVVNYYRQKAA